MILFTVLAVLRVLSRGVWLLWAVAGASAALGASLPIPEGERALLAVAAPLLVLDFGYSFPDPWGRVPEGALYALLWALSLIAFEAEKVRRE